MHKLLSFSILHAYKMFTNEPNVHFTFLGLVFHTSFSEPLHALLHSHIHQGGKTFNLTSQCVCETKRNQNKFSKSAH